MKVKTFLLIILLAFYGYANAQEQCSCNDALQKIILKIESEYPGFDIKAKDKLIYNSIKERTIKRALDPKNAFECLDILKTYTGFFKDKHIWVLPNEVASHPFTAPENQGKVIVKSIDVDLKKFKKDIMKRLNEYEGIWKNGNYEIGIKKLNKNEYVGFIINADPRYWKPNDIKFRLFADGNYEYYMQDYSIQRGVYKLYGGSLLYFDLLKSAFTKQMPSAPLTSEEIEDKINNINGFNIKILTPKTIYIRLSNFSYIFVDTIEKLIRKNKDLIESSEFLIVDVRDNGGGTDAGYHSILPYINTNPIRHVGAEYLSSLDFIRNSEEYLGDMIKDSVRKKDEIADLKSRIAILKSNIGKYVNFNNNKVSTDTIETASKSPRQIVILANNHTASAAENFLLKAKQSKKTKIMGIPSSGVLDYANAMFFEYGCDNYKLLMPTYRSFRLPDYPIDNIGIQPDIYLDESVPDWIEFAIHYLVIP